VSKKLIINKQVIQYLAIGATTVCIDIGLMALLHSMFGVNVYLAATVSFWTSLVFNFCANKFYTFNVAANTVQHAGTYLTLVGINYFVGLMMIALGAHLGINYIVAKLGAIVLTTCWNFLLYKYIVFIKDNIVVQARKGFSVK